MAVVVAMAVAVTVCLACFSWLDSLSLLCLASFGFRPRSWPRSKMGGGAMAVGSRCALAAQGEDGGGQQSSLHLVSVAACAGRSWGGGAAALASLALLGVRSGVMVGCGG